jgi:hypothetical protein
MASDTCKINISVEWHGDKINREIEQQWWDKVTAEEIIGDIELEILGLEL